MAFRPGQVNGHLQVASIRMFTLAHLSDVHLAPLPRVAPGKLLNKRFFGFQSWRRNRVRVHFREIADAIRDDINQAAPDHVAITGDLVNIALEEEFSQAAGWLQAFGPPDHISVVPGNHDAYVPVPFETGIGLWRDYMAGDHLTTNDEAIVFPYLRRRGDIAIIGLSTSVPTAPLSARGWLGEEQVAALAELLDHMADEKLFRVILIHHPPLPAQNPWRKAMADTNQFVDVVRKHGAELVLHGHNHRQMLAHIECDHDRIPVFGVASASARQSILHPAAHYNLYRIQRANDEWACEVTVRAWQDQRGCFDTVDTFFA